MSTRCTIECRDERGAHTVYRHMDGYPDTEHGVLATLAKALPYAWPLPRFEADDFAAAIVAAWKDGGGNIRLTKGRDAHGDTEWHYLVTARKGAVRVEVFEADRNWTADTVAWTARPELTTFLVPAKAAA